MKTIRIVDSLHLAAFRVIELGLLALLLCATGVAVAGPAAGVVAGPAGVKLSGNPSPSVYGQTVLFTATVTSAGGGPIAPTGSVRFTASAPGFPISVALSGGMAQLATSELPPGVIKVKASYGGDATFAPSDSPEITHAVQKAPTSTTLTSSANPSQPASSVAFTAVVAGANGAQPFGSVRFAIDGVALATVSLLAGSASYDAGRLDTGSHTVIASYLGNQTHAASDSDSLKQVIGLRVDRNLLGHVCGRAICVLRDDGNGSIQVTDPQQATDTYPLAFSPDGLRVAFRRVPDESKAAQLWIVELDGGRLTLVAPALTDVTSFAWSPDGRSLVLSANGELHVADSRGSASRALLGFAHGHVFAFDPAWSPDGKAIAYAASFTGNPASQWSGSQIYEARVDGSAVRQVTAGGSADMAPSYSPDGAVLSFCHFLLPREREANAVLSIVNGDASWLGATGDVYATAPADHVVANLTEVGDALSGRVSPEGSRVTVTRIVNGKVGLFVVDTRGAYYPVGLPGLPAIERPPMWSHDGHRLAFQAGGEIYVAEADGSALHKVSSGGSGRNAYPVWAP